MYALHRYSIYINMVGTLHNDLILSPFPVPSDPHGIYHKLYGAEFSSFPLAVYVPRECSTFCSRLKYS